MRTRSNSSWRASVDRLRARQLSLALPPLVTRGMLALRLLWPPHYLQGATASRETGSTSEPPTASEQSSRDNAGSQLAGPASRREVEHLVGAGIPANAGLPTGSAIVVTKSEAMSKDRFPAYG